jgi:hypothetical protein
MEQKLQKLERAHVSSHTHQAGFQNILIDILKTALEPLPFKSKVTKILDYILALNHLHVGTKAALFLVNHDTNTLDLLISRGFTNSEALVLPARQLESDIVIAAKPAKSAKQASSAPHHHSPATPGKQSLSPATTAHP